MIAKNMKIFFGKRNHRAMISGCGVKLLPEKKNNQLIMYLGTLLYVLSTYVFIKISEN